MVINKQLVIPEDLNPHGTMFGGKIMSEIDKAAAIYVMELSNLPAVTLKVSEILFKVPIFAEDIYTISCDIEKLGTTSVTVKTTVTRKATWGDDETELAVEASIIMVTVNRSGKAIPHGIKI